MFHSIRQNFSPLHKLFSSPFCIGSIRWKSFNNKKTLPLIDYYCRIYSFSCSVGNYRHHHHQQQRMMSSFASPSLRWLNLIDVTARNPTITTSNNNNNNGNKTTTTSTTTVSSKVQLSILGNGANTNPISVLVGTDQESFLINCGESVQRLIFEHKIQFAKVKHILFTSGDHRHYAGLYGLLLSMAPIYDTPTTTTSATNVNDNDASYSNNNDDNVDKMVTVVDGGDTSTTTSAHLRLYAPSGALSTISSVYDPFMPHASNLVLHHRQFSPSLPPSSLSSSNKELLWQSVDLSVYGTPYYVSPNSNTFSSSSVTMDYRHIAMIYQFVVHDKPGPLLIEKCKQLQVPPGPLFSKLKSGHSIVLPNGTTVQPEQVLGTPEPGRNLIILECPTIDHIESLIDCWRTTIERHQQRPLSLVVHITPVDVFRDSRYQAWINDVADDSVCGGKTWSKETQHLILNEANTFEPLLRKSSSLQIKLNQVNEKFFPLLNEHTPSLSSSMVNNQQQQWQFDTNIRNTRVITECPTMLTYQARVGKKISIGFESDTHFPGVDHEDIRSRIQSNEDFAHALTQYQSQMSFIDSDDNANDGGGGDHQQKPNLLFLGTASATPGQQRNTTAMLLTIRPGQSSILLDAAESTFLQLNRFYGATVMHERILPSLSIIFISHNHADHHFGLARLVVEWVKNQQRQRSSSPSSTTPCRKLYIIGPYAIGEFLRRYTATIATPSIGDLAAYYCFIPNQVMQHNGGGGGSGDNVSTQDDNMKFPLIDVKHIDGLQSIETVPVPHCRDSYGVVIKFNDDDDDSVVVAKKKDNQPNNTKIIAYSGDSERSTVFNEPARGALLLVHEATMDDDLRLEATKKRHSTISDAIIVGENCGAQCTMLTHFSQRYSKIAPPISALVNRIKADNAATATTTDDLDVEQTKSKLCHYIEHCVGVSFDFMQIPLTTAEEVCEAAKMRPLLELLFADEIEELQDKQQKKVLKRKLIEDTLKIHTQEKYSSSSSSGNMINAKSNVRQQ